MELLNLVLSAWLDNQPVASDWCWEVSWSWPASTSERYVPPELTQRL